jgi:hypothetical protein
MKGIAGKAAAVVGLAAAAAWAGPTIPGPIVEPDPAPAPEAPSETLKIVELKLSTEQLKLDAVKAQAGAKSQKEKDEIGVIIQTLDAIYARLEHMLDNA